MATIGGSAEKIHYVLNQGVEKWMAQSNQYFPKQNQSTTQGRAISNQLKEAITALAPGQPQPVRGLYPQCRFYNSNFYD